MARPIPRLTPEEIRSVIALAWDDRPPFNAVVNRHGLTAGHVVQLLRRELTPNAFKMWMARTRAPKAAPTAAPRKVALTSPSARPRR
jgi:uncharacterized protein (TIGR03643 family)